MFYDKVCDRSVISYQKVFKLLTFRGFPIEQVGKVKCITVYSGFNIHYTGSSVYSLSSVTLF